MNDKDQPLGRKKPEQSQSQRMLIPNMKEELTATSKFLRLYDDLPGAVKSSFLDTMEMKVLPQLRKQLDESEAGEVDEEPIFGDDSSGK